jgi:hypothetical protein
VVVNPRPQRNLNEYPELAFKESTPGIRRRVLTEKDLHRYVLSQLGHPYVTVEVQPGQFHDLVDAALDEYNRMLPLEKTDTLSGAASSLNYYNLKERGKPYGRGVNSVRVLTKENFFSPISGVFALGIPHPISHLSPDQYDLAIRYIQTAKKIYSAEQEFKWEEPVLWLYAPSGFGGPFMVSYDYTQDAARVEDVPQEDVSWLKKYLLALTKVSVGSARRKFGTVPGPASQSLDGSDLVREGMEEKRIAEEEILSRSLGRAPPLGPHS